MGKNRYKSKSPLFATLLIKEVILLLLKDYKEIACEHLDLYLNSEIIGNLNIFLIKIINNERVTY